MSYVVLGNSPVLVSNDEGPRVAAIATARLTVPTVGHTVVPRGFLLIGVIRLVADMIEFGGI